MQRSTVGGANALLSPDLTINACRAHMLSPDSRCKTFDSTANGYVRSEGVGKPILPFDIEWFRNGGVEAFV